MRTPVFRVMLASSEVLENHAHPPSTLVPGRVGGGGARWLPAGNPGPAPPGALAAPRRHLRAVSAIGTYPTSVRGTNGRPGDAGRGKRGPFSIVPIAVYRTPIW